MENVLEQAIILWQLEAAVVISILLTALLVWRAMKVWRAPDCTSYVFVLGIGLLAAAFLFYNFRDRLHVFTDRNALLFVLLYCWCALGTVFLAARQTHVLKLCIGLASQAGIVYGLYRLI